MHESSGFDEGRLEEIHRHLLCLGRMRFGPPTTAAEAEIRAIRNQERLERLLDAMLTVHSWREFLAAP